MKKQQLREEYKLKRKALSDEEIKIFEKSICLQIRNLDFSLVQNVHVFLPIKRQKEVNTYPIIDFLRKIDKQIIISKSNFENNTLTHYIFEKRTELLINKWGIPEPINAIEINVKNIDLVFVPLLISDKKHYRVGYGKGFYDRFLSECKSSVKTIGLNFFSPIQEIEDVGVFDVPLDKVIYP